jgi:hypothetical protein
LKHQTFTLLYRMISHQHVQTGISYISWYKELPAHLTIAICNYNSMGHNEFACLLMA